MDGNDPRRVGSSRNLLQRGSSFRTAGPGTPHSHGEGVSRVPSFGSATGGGPNRGRSFRLGGGTGLSAAGGRRAGGAAPRFVLPTPHAFAGGKPQLRIHVRSIRLGVQQDESGGNTGGMLALEGGSSDRAVETDTDAAMVAGTASLVELLDWIDGVESHGSRTSKSTSKPEDQRKSAGAVLRQKLKAWCLFRDGVTIRLPIRDPTLPEAEKWAMLPAGRARSIPRGAGQLTSKVTFLPYALQTTALPKRTDAGGSAGTGSASSAEQIAQEASIEFRCQGLGAYGRLYISVSTSAVAVDSGQAVSVTSASCGLRRHARTSGSRGEEAGELEAVYGARHSAKTSARWTSALRQDLDAVHRAGDAHGADSANDASGIRLEPRVASRMQRPTEEGGSLSGKGRPADEESAHVFEGSSSFSAVNVLAGSLPLVHVDASHVSDGMAGSGGAQASLAAQLRRVEWSSNQPVLVSVTCETGRQLAALPAAAMLPIDNVVSRPFEVHRTAVRATVDPTSARRLAHGGVFPGDDLIPQSIWIGISVQFLPSLAVVPHGLQPATSAMPVPTLAPPEAAVSAAIGDAVSGALVRRRVPHGAPFELSGLVSDSLKQAPVPVLLWGLEAGSASTTEGAIPIDVVVAVARQAACHAGARLLELGIGIDLLGSNAEPGAASLAESGSMTRLGLAVTLLGLELAAEQHLAVLCGAASESAGKVGGGHESELGGRSKSRNRAGVRMDGPPARRTQTAGARGRGSSRGNRNRAGSR